MKTFFLFLLGLIALLSVVYFLGPKPDKPTFNSPKVELPVSLTDLEKKINDDEKAVKGIKPNNEARIIWADSSKKEKTPIAILYLHGYSASQAEGDPVHKDIAKKYHANLYLSRLEGHGIDAGNETMANITVDNFVASAEKALEITKKLGNEVIIIGTSAGGALTLFLASRHPELKAIVVYSPCVKIFDKTAIMLDKPWGLQIAKKVVGSDFKESKNTNKSEAQYWSLRYRLEAVVTLQNFIDNAMLPENFAKIKCPVYLAYYYKNEQEQDNVVSVPAMLQMYDELGTPANLKRKEAFPNSGNHVIASSLVSGDWKGVETGTDNFLREIVKLKE